MASALHPVYAVHYALLSRDRGNRGKTALRSVSRASVLPHHRDKDIDSQRHDGVHVYPNTQKFYFLSFQKIFVEFQSPIHFKLMGLGWAKVFSVFLRTTTF